MLQKAIFRLPKAQNARSAKCPERKMPGAQNARSARYPARKISKAQDAQSRVRAFGCRLSAGFFFIIPHFQTEKKPPQARSILRSMIDAAQGLVLKHIFTRLQLLQKNATTKAPGPTCVPMVPPTVLMGRESACASQSARLSSMYFCSSVSSRPV